MSPGESHSAKEISMDDVFLNRIREYVLDNISNEEFSLESLSSEIGYSRSQIHRKLKRITGKSLSAFVKEIRLDEALRLLKIKAGTVSDIAYRTGFSSPAYFNKCFTDYYGVTPGEVGKQVIQMQNKITEKQHNFWQELKRRKVIRVIIGYAAAAYVLLELTSIVAEPLGLPVWTINPVLVLLCIGFIISVVVSWLYDSRPCNE